MYVDIEDSAYVKGTTTPIEFLNYSFTFPIIPPVYLC